MTFVPAPTRSVQLRSRTACTAVPFKPLLLVAGLLAGAVQTAMASTLTAAPAKPNAPATNGTAPTAAFDLEMLQGRGLNPKIATFFRQAPRFTEGRRRVTLQVNGSARGSVNALFDADGELCFDQALLDQGNLNTPGSGSAPAEDTQCYDFITAYPQTEVELRPNREEVSLLVSTDALRPASADLGGYTVGGLGGLFNYEVLGQNNQFSGSDSSYYSTNTEVGFNAGDWIVRSRQSYSVQNEVGQFQSLYSYAQKTFVPLKSTLQAGQINIANSVFPGAAITGAQVVPDAALQGRSLGGATVEGIAQSSARVEVRQAGALIHTSLVPAGPFRLQNVQLLNGATDLDVRVIESSGEQRSFTVPAAALAQVSLNAPGYSVAAGQVRTFDNRDMQSPRVITGSGGWLLTPSQKLSSGLMLSDNGYQAVAWTLDSNVTPKTWVNVRNTVANASEERVRGTEASVSVSTSLTQNLSASINATRQTAGFRNLMDTTRVQTPDYAGSLSRDQYGVSLGWNDDWLGGFTAGYSTSNSFDGRNSQHLTASWGKTFKHATVNFNVERTMGSSNADDDHQSNDNYFGRDRRFDDNDIAMYLTVSVPLGGKRSVRGYANKRDGITRLGTTYSDNSHDFATYRLSAEHNVERQEQDFSGNVNLLPRFAQVNLGYSQNSRDSASYTGQLRGGVVIHDNGVTLSPYPLADTFGVAKVGDVGGVKLITPSGPVWTDPWGNAVIAQLNAYTNTRIEIDTKSLPRNVDIQNGFKAVSVGRGSVNTLDFPVIKSRRLLLQVTDGAGKTMPKGAAVLDAQGNFVTAVVDEGNVFIINDQLGEGLSISTAEGQSCAIHFKLAPEPDLNVYFEVAEATCEAGG